ncbi:conserved Plasmodium protein, unknown function [Plasmodium malariae]|uniref:RecQ mediated genome instability protein 1 OB-fold domain-containing protein n=1 Tax=Plasmodium malariae TaxID=5858 RepID=A0A1A8VYS0_PLAMA|nr:conserved Plasmodium protein, unknown function [Plasmodium malariae]
MKKLIEKNVIKINYNRFLKQYKTNIGCEKDVNDKELYEHFIINPFTYSQPFGCLPKNYSDIKEHYLDGVNIFEIVDYVNISERMYKFENVTEDDDKEENDELKDFMTNSESGEMDNMEVSTTRRRGKKNKKNNIKKVGSRKANRDGRVDADQVDDDNDDKKDGNQFNNNNNRFRRMYRFLLFDGNSFIYAYEQQFNENFNYLDMNKYKYPKIILYNRPTIRRGAILLKKNQAAILFKGSKIAEAYDNMEENEIDEVDPIRGQNNFIELAHDTTKTDNFVNSTIIHKKKEFNKNVCNTTRNFYYDNTHSGENCYNKSVVKNTSNKILYHSNNPGNCNWYNQQDVDMFGKECTNRSYNYNFNGDYHSMENGKANYYGNYQNEDKNRIHNSSPYSTYKNESNNFNSTFKSDNSNCCVITNSNSGNNGNNISRDEYTSVNVLANNDNYSYSEKCHNNNYSQKHVNEYQTKHGSEFLIKEGRNSYYIKDSTNYTNECDKFYSRRCNDDQSTKFINTYSDMRDTYHLTRCESSEKRIKIDNCSEEIRNKRNYNDIKLVNNQRLNNNMEEKRCVCFDSNNNPNNSNNNGASYLNDKGNYDYVDGCNSEICTHQKKDRYAFESETGNNCLGKPFENVHSSISHVHSSNSICYNKNYDRGNFSEQDNKYCGKLHNSTFSAKNGMHDNSDVIKKDEQFNECNQNNHSKNSKNSTDLIDLTEGFFLSDFFHKSKDLNNVNNNSDVIILDD